MLSPSGESISRHRNKENVKQKIDGLGHIKILNVYAAKAAKSKI